MEESKETTKDWWDELTESQKQQIQEGLEDVEKGRVMTSAEFWERLKSEK
jgi:predicted transcriptional regulator